METKYLILIIEFLLALSTFTDAKYHNLSLQNVTHVTRGSFFDPTVLKLRNQLLYLSFPKLNTDYKIKLESTAIKETCEITVSVPKDSDVKSTRATILGNEKLVVTFLEKAAIELEPSIRFHILDPLKGCAVDTSFSLDVDDAILWSNDPFVLIAYQDTFDVFVKSSKHCQPTGSLCLLRYNDKGARLGTIMLNLPIVHSNIDLVKLHPLQEFSYSDGYFFLSKHTSELKIFDHNLQTLRNLTLDGFISAHAVLNGDISVCYQVVDDPPHTQCLKLNSNLKTVANISLSNSHYFVSKRLYNLADGSALFVKITWNKFSTSVRRISVDGRVSLPEYYLYHACETYQEPKDRFIELKGGVYCFTFVCNFNMVTHCIKSSESENLLTYD